MDSTSNPPRLFLVTSNVGKLREVRDILQGVEVENRPLDLPELQGKSAVEISRQKAAEAFRQVGHAVIVDDTSLCFHALGGLPGPYIKWFLDSAGCVGLHKMLVGFNDFKASAKCIFVLAECPDAAKAVVFEGVVPGTIVEPRGDNGFGWDKVFQPDGWTKTFAEMTQEEKNSISHRKLALLEMKRFFDTRKSAAADADVSARKRSRSATS